MLEEDSCRDLSCVSAWVNTGIAARITNRPALLHGVVVLNDASAGHATVYAGPDASGRKIGTFSGQNYVSTPVYFRPPLLCENGIYVGNFDHIVQVIVFFSVI